MNDMALLTLSRKYKTQDLYPPYFEDVVEF